MVVPALAKWSGRMTFETSFVFPILLTYLSIYFIFTFQVFFLSLQYDDSNIKQTKGITNKETIARF